MDRMPRRGAALGAALGGVIFVLELALARDAFAQPSPWQSPSAFEPIVAGALQRARRAVSFGPMLGGAPVYAPSPGSGDGALSFGLELNLFDVPVAPTPDALHEMIVERTKARVTELVADRIQHGRPRPDRHELAELARKVFEDVKAEITAELAVQPKLLEKPRLSLAVEATRLFRSEAWQTRLVAGIGIKVVTIGPTLGAHFGAANDFFLGGEIAAHLTPGDGPR